MPNGKKVLFIKSISIQINLIMTKKITRLKKQKRKKTKNTFKKQFAADIKSHLAPSNIKMKQNFKRKYGSTEITSKIVLRSVSVNCAIVRRKLV